MLRALFLATLVACAAGCGDDASGNDMGLCNSALRTCGSSNICGNACNPQTDTPCNESSICLYTCKCVIDHWDCRGDNLPVCFVDMAHRMDLALTD